MQTQTLTILSKTTQVPDGVVPPLLEPFVNREIDATTQDEIDGNRMSDDGARELD